MKTNNTATARAKQLNISILKAILLFSNLAAITIYLFLRIIFNGFGISFSEDAVNLLQTVFTANALGAGLYFLYVAMLFITRSFDERRVSGAATAGIFSRLHIALGTLIVAFVFFSCSTHVSVGVKKDFSTGLTASYKNMEPEEVLLVMNGEVLTHNDIPIGESFILANKNIKGLVVKDGKISAGCSLRITDKAGKVILENADLLKGNDVFDSDAASLLKCNITTGEPMEWEENYDVVVTFWDKYGDGKIENKVNIRMIDMP